MVPALWLARWTSPVTLLLAAAGVGAVLLAVAYALGTVNRWREGGWPAALYAPSGVAGSRAVPRRRPGRPDGTCSQRRCCWAAALAAWPAWPLACAGFLAAAGGGAAG